MTPNIASFVGPVIALALAFSLSQPPVPAQPPSKAPAAAGQVAWKDLFDGKSLDGWKASDFGGDGKVTLKDGAVVMEKGLYMTGITYSRGDFPKTDYEVSLEGKRLDGDDFFCTTTFPVGDDFCSFVVGGWGGTIVGLSSIDDLDAAMNDTSTRKEFERGQWYRVRIRVTRDRIQAWIDDGNVVDLAVGEKTISIRRECAPSKPFGIATWRTTGAIRAVRVRALTDAEKKDTASK